MWYCALDEHAFNHIPPGLAVLLLGPYYTTYLEVDLDEEEIPTGMERARGYSRLSYCGEIAPPSFASVGEWACSSCRNLRSRRSCEVDLAENTGSLEGFDEELLLILNLWI